MAEHDTIKVIVAMDFSPELIARIQGVSSLLDVQQHFPDVPAEAWAEAEILYTVRHFPQPDEAPQLRWIQLNYAGAEGALRQPIVQRADVVVTSASGIHARQMANYCLMMMLAFNYRLPQMFRYQRANEWPKNRFSIFEPVDMHRQTVGIVGYGSIGRELARLCQAMGMRVLASKRRATQPNEGQYSYTPEGIGDPAGEIPDRIYPIEALESLARESDYLVIATPMTDETEALIDARILQAMKPTAVLVNVARGGVVDEQALIDALDKDQIAGAALDVFREEPLPPDSPLWAMDQVIISPHVSGNSAHYHEKAAELFIANLKRYLDNRPLMNPLDVEKGY